MSGQAERVVANATESLTKDARSTTTPAAGRFEQVICPKCQGPFFRDNPDRDLCGICFGRLAGVHLKRRTAATPPQPEDDTETWEDSLERRDGDQEQAWPSGVRFEDAAVPRERSLGIVRMAHDYRQGYGDSSMVENEAGRVRRARAPR